MRILSKQYRKNLLPTTRKQRWASQRLPVVAAFLIFSIACSSGTNSTSTSTSNTTATTVAATSTTATTVATTVPAEPIRVGGVFPLSGGAASLGEPARNGLELAFSEVDNQIAGRPIELVLGDDGANPDQGLSETRRILSDGIDIWAGWIFSGVALAGIPEVDAAGIPWIVAYASDDAITPMLGDRGFRTGTTTSQLVNAGVAFIDDQGWKTLSVVGHDITAFRSIVEALGERSSAEIVNETWIGLDVLDFVPFLGSVDLSNSDAMFAMATANVIPFVQQVDQLGLKDQVPIWGAPSTISESLLPEMGTAADGLVGVIGYAWGIDTPENIAFREAYESAYGVSPPSEAFYGYAAGQVIVRALTAVDGNVEDVDAVVSAMEQVQFTSPAGEFQFDESHVPLVSYYAIEIRQVDGAYHLMPTAEYERLDPHPPAS